ncbi:aa3-type cytochrome c oxidase subunit IV [Sphingomonas radiodurans]|nr:aa3-type cytochrome c oxidase subunit IV [Sphingomonas radiodurans]WBH16121.1 aa3-type cytochrome c oxidase subunit IV [Sphingomonas radiodurans]
MADHRADAGDIKAHAATYDGVISLLKWGTIVSVLIAALVVWLIA